MVDLTGATEPVGAAVPTGAAGVVLLTKVGGTTGATEGATGAVPTGVTLGTGVTLTGAGAALVATSTGEEDGTTGLTTGTELGTTGTALVGATTGAELTGLVTVQGQLVIVKVVAWKKSASVTVLVLRRNFPQECELPQSQHRLKTRG